MSTSPNTRRANGDGIVIAGGGLAGQRCAETLRRAGYEQRDQDGVLGTAPAVRPPAAVQGAAGRRRARRRASVSPRAVVPRPAGRPAARRERRTPGARRTSDRALRRQRAALRQAADRHRRPAADAADPLRLRERVRAAHARRRRAAARGARLAPAARGGRRRIHRARDGGDRPQARRRGDADRGGCLSACKRARPEAGRVVSAAARGRRASTSAPASPSSESTPTAPHGRCVCPTAPSCRSITSSSGPGSTRMSRGWPTAGSTPRVACAVDVHGRTAVEDVFAAGDAAATFDESSRRHVPGSHWEAAGRQGAVRPARCSGSTRAPRRRRASGPISTGCGSSTWAGRSPPTRSRSTATPTVATSPPPFPVPDGQSPRCSSIGLVPYRRLAS